MNPNDILAFMQALLPATTIVGGFILSYIVLSSIVKGIINSKNDDYAYIIDQFVRQKDAAEAIDNAMDGGELWFDELIAIDATEKSKRGGDKLKRDEDEDVLTDDHSDIAPDGIVFEKWR